MQALEFPRSLVRDNLDLQECVHNGNYAADDDECRQCVQGFECEWLYGNDEFVALDRKPLKELAAALDFALEFVDMRISEWGHNRGSCRCEACAWRREAQRLADRIFAES